MINLTLEDIDRTIYSLIREELVLSGLLPDITQFQNANGEVAYKNAKIQIGNRLTEVFGVGASYNRDEKIINRITINRKSINPGSLGGFPEKEYKKKPNGNFEKYEIQNQSFNLEYEVRFVTKKVSMERELHNVIMDAIPMRNYTHVRTTGGVQNNSDEKTFFIQFDGGATIQSSGDVIEKMYKYNVVDAWINKNKLIDADYPALTSVDFCIILETQQGIVSGSPCNHLDIQDITGDSG